MSRAWRLCGAGLGAMLWLAAPDPARPEPAGGSEAHCRTSLQEFIANHHLDPRHLDVGEVCAEGERRAAAGESRYAIARWIEQQADDALHGFADPFAVADVRALYRLPYVAWIPRFVAQGNAEGRSHQSAVDRYAFDFVMPLGTPVLAARGGTVARVMDGSTERAVADPQGDRGNTVMVLHEDGTFAVYAHLEPGIAVEEGRVVRAGELLGRSGNTGYCHGPHLHFVVRRRKAGGGAEAVPIRFAAPEAGGRVPGSGRHEGRLVPSRQALSVHVDGRRVDPKRPSILGVGSDVRLAVRLGGPEGKDVTDHPRTRYETMTPWNVHTNPGGVLAGGPAEGFEVGKRPHATIDPRVGLAFVFFGTPADSDFGWARVPLTITY